MNSNKFYKDKLKKLNEIIDDVQRRRDETYELQLFYIDIYQEYQKMLKTYNSTLGSLNSQRTELEQTIRSIHTPDSAGQEKGGG